MRGSAILGVGAVTPLGDSFPGTWEALIAGRTAIAPIRRFDARRYPVRFGAEVAARGHGPALYDAVLDQALDEALAGLHLDGVDPARIGVFVGAEAVRPELGDLAAEVLGPGGAPPQNLAEFLPAARTARVVRRLGARGPSQTQSTACTSSGQSVGEALLAIRRGEVDLAVVAGVDMLVHPLMIAGFSRLGALSTRNDDPAAACRPFDRGRDGFVLGEGAGVMVLGAPQLAGRVGPLLGWLTGYGCSCNAWRITDSPPDGRGAAQAMRWALNDAGRAPGEVAYINAHGTGTQQNDVSEAAGIRRALGAEAAGAAVSSTKSAMGHLVAACGVVEAMIALRAAIEGVAPPTLNLDDPDPDCALRHVPRFAAPIRPGVALSNAFGFGGSNATLVLEAP